MFGGMSPMKSVSRSLIGLFVGGAVGILGPWILVYALDRAEGQPARLGNVGGAGLEVCGCSMICGMGGATLGALLGSLIQRPPQPTQRHRRRHRSDDED